MWFFFSLTLFVSAALFFLAQPMCAKMLLPHLGGAPAVWNTCMVFFQAGLLAGYAYAHAGPRLLGRKLHAALHLGLLLLAFVFLPIALGKEAPPAEAYPEFWLMKTLVLAAGLPFFLVASTAPLLQSWFAASGRPGSDDPYFLYAASNLGSLLALFSYPFLVEPNITLPQQTLLWRIGYGLLVLCTGGCGLVLWGRNIPIQSPSPGSVTEGDLDTPAWRWVFLAFVPSSLLLSVTSHLTRDLAAIPLLWVLPLGLYLLTYILVFSSNFSRFTRLFRGGLPLVVLLLVLALLSEANEPLVLVMGLHLAGFFWIAMACHGELARTRPPVEYLTEYYFWLALGGVLGGAFNALLAPLLFNSLAEYPLMLVLACILVPTVRRRVSEDAKTPEPNITEGGNGAPQSRVPGVAKRWDYILPMLIFAFTLTLVLAGQHYHIEPGPISIVVMFALPMLICYTFIERPVRFGLGLLAILLASAFYSGIHGETVFKIRTFFGVHRVAEKEGYRFLIHGTTVHGQQSLDPLREGEPLTYYHRKSPIGQVFKALKGDPRLERVGLIGLGTGALACYSEKNQQWTFFEIDPAVILIAENLRPEPFSYLRNAQGKMRMVVGDGRIGLAKSADSFGLIVVDAFSSDAIPLHLLTREALRIYRSKLQKGGILAFHISNRYVDLEPVLANLAKDAGMTCLVQRDLRGLEDRKAGKWASDWVVLANAADDLKTIAANRKWQPARADASLGVWTDDFSNLFSVFQWRAKED